MMGFPPRPVVRTALLFLSSTACGNDFDALFAHGDGGGVDARASSGADGGDASTNDASSSACGASCKAPLSCGSACSCDTCCSCPDIVCDGDDSCDVSCAATSTCNVQCSDLGGCDVHCEPGAQCLLHCSGDAPTCALHCAGHDPTRCGEGTFVCNRGCP